MQTFSLYCFGISEIILEKYFSCTCVVNCNFPFFYDLKKLIKNIENQSVTLTYYHLVLLLIFVNSFHYILHKTDLFKSKHMSKLM